MPAKYCSKKADVPKGKHYAIIVFDSFLVPGDERSRTNPGHGYPAHTETTSQYIAYTNRAEWEKEITRLTLEKGYGSKDFVPLVVDNVEVKTEVVVKIES